MNYLSPEIAAHAKHASKKSLAKLGVSCGIFQDCFDTDLKNVEELVDLKKSKNE